MKYNYPFGYVPSNGEQFGKWVVTNNTVTQVGRAPRTARAVECTCECGKVQQVRILSLTSGKSVSCTCAGGIHKRAKAKELAVGNLSKTHLHEYKRCAKRRDISWDVTPEYIWELLVKQDFKCALSGLPLILELQVGPHNTASLDRIDSTKAYEEGNVQWVHKDINRMKGNFSDEQFIQLCKAVTDHLKSS